MNGFSDDVVSEAVEISEAVFSDDRRVFEDEYDGEVDDYLLIRDLRSRIEEAMMDTDLGVPYMDELPSFEDFGYDADSWAHVFYSVEPDVSHEGLADVSGFSASHVSNVVEDFEQAGLIESEGKERRKKYFYGENALPYLMVFQEAETVVEEADEEVQEDFLNEELEIEDVEEQESGQENQVDPEEVADGSGEEKSLQDIMMDAVDSEEDLKTTYEQREDGGVESRDHTDSDPDEETSNPNEDEYYEGW